jgi:hypothetical protein
MKKSKSSKNSVGCGIYDKTVNFLTGSKLKSGEMHAVIYDPVKKKYTTSNYTGPGTDLLTRLKRGDEPKVLSDKVSKFHDIRYTLSKDVNDIKNADKKMVDKLKELQKNKQDLNFNIRPAKWGIQANQLLAKILPDKYFDSFVNYMTDYKKSNKELTEEDRKLLEDELKKGEAEGYGKKKKRKYKTRKLRKFN